VGEVETVGELTDADLRQSILAELVELAGVRMRQPCDFTIADFSEASGLSDQTARRRLATLKGQGIIDSAHTIENGRQVRVYWKVDDAC